MKQLQNLSAWVCVVALAVVMVACGGGGSSNGAPPPATLQSIQVTPGTPSIALGLGQQFKATGTYSDHTTRDLTNSSSWSSSSATVATISSTGMATSKAQGSTTITASYSGMSSTATLTVTAPVLASIAVAPSTASLPLGTTVQLTATGALTDGTTQDMTASVQWSSSNPAIVSINANGTFGLALATEIGSSTITATSAGISSSASLTVTSPVLQSIAISPLTASIAQGTTLQFIASGNFSDGSTQNITGSVQWTSSNPSVAGINYNGAAGLTMGLTAGNSTITAISGSISSTAALTVTSATVTSIAVTPVSPSIPLGTLQQFTATGTFSDGSTQDITGTVTWSSSKTSVVSITVSGLATARNLGTATITAASGSVSGTATATVNAADLASLAIQPGDTTIAVGTSQQFSAIGTFNDGSTHDLTSQATWTSSNTGVAKIASSGLAKGLAPGSSTISAAVGSVTASVNLTVSSATVVSIAVTPVGRTIAPGTKLAFTATGTFSDSSTQVITRDATWASDNAAVATVNGSGLVTAIASGTANISATFNGVTGSTALTVSSVTLASIAITPSSASLAPASTLGLTATGTYSDNSTQNITNAVTWVSSAPNVASVSNSGQVTAQSAGSATITAQQGSVISPGAFIVVESSGLVSLQLSPATATVAQQTAVQFRAIATFADGSTQDLTQSASWASSPSSVATVSDVTGNKGFATGLAPGTATITALFAGEVGSATLTVTSATLTSITITPANPSIQLGTSQWFTATGNFSDGTTQNLSSQVAWTSSNVNVATISPTGLANSVATGTTTITAAMNGVSATTVLTVY